MKRTIMPAVLFVLLFSMPAFAGVSVGVRVSIPLPRLVITAPPALVVIPGTYVYAAPDVGSDLVFYEGYWYRPYEGHWYRSGEYNGHWEPIHESAVPRPLIGLPPNWRQESSSRERMPYGDVKQNWRGWERDRHWDRGERRGGRDVRVEGRPARDRGEAREGRAEGRSGERYDDRGRRDGRKKHGKGKNGGYDDDDRYDEHPDRGYRR